MGFGVDKNIPVFYRNRITILCVILVLLILSIDTVNRYFSLLSLDDLENSSIYTKLRIVLFLFLSLAYLFDRKSYNSKILNLLYLYCLFSLVSIFIYSETMQELIKSVIQTFTFVLMFRYGVLFGSLNHNFSSTIFSILLLITIILYQFFEVYIFNSGSIFLISNDAIFSLIVFVPFLFFLKNRKLIMFFLLLICLFTLFSQKRSVIFFLNLSLIVAAFIYFIKYSKVKLSIISVIVILFGFSFFDSLKNAEFMSLAIHRFENDGDNGRDQISNQVLAQFYDGNMINYLFGYGYSATVKHNGVPSHNDFLEIVYDFGIFSLICYCLVIVLLGIKCFVWFRYRLLFIDYYLSFVVAYIILLGLSLYNCMIFSVYTIVLFLSLGISYGYITNKMKL